MISADMLLAFVKVAENLSVSKTAIALAVGKSVMDLTRFHGRYELLY